jgi:hypothetical protein
MAICVTVEYLAVSQMPHRWSRKLRGTLLRRGCRLPRAWHAVPAHRTASTALCGFRYTREPHRTWTQTIVSRRCRKCQRRIDELEARANDPSANPLWAVPTPEVTEHDRGVGAVTATTPTTPELGAEFARRGVARAT